MSDDTIAVTFYHSVVCPRCHCSGRALRAALRKRPDVQVTKVDFLTHGEQARRDGVRSIPSLVARGRSLTGFLLTKARIERFLDSLSAEPAGGD